MTFLLLARFALLAALAGVAIGLVYLERGRGAQRPRTSARRALD